MRTKSITLLALAFFSSSMLSGGDITVKITNISSDKGEIAVALYNNQKGYRAKKAYKGVRLRSRKGSLVYKFKGLRNGVYSVAVYHDENSNKKLDTTIFGIPTEDYGFSNNIKPTFRKARFVESKFTLKKHKQIHINIGPWLK